MDCIWGVFTYKCEPVLSIKLSEACSMVEEKKGFCFIYLKRTHHLPSVVKFYKPVEKQTVSFAYSPLQRGGLFFFPSFFLWFSQEIHYKRIERQSFGHLERFTNNQHWPFLGVKSHFDTEKVTLGTSYFSPWSTTWWNQIHFYLLPPFVFLRAWTAWRDRWCLVSMLGGVGWHGGANKPSSLGPVYTCNLPSISGPHYVIDIDYL